MQKLHTSASASDFAFGASDVSQIVRLGDIDEVTVRIVGDASTGTLTMQTRTGPAATWVTYTYGGTDQTWTNATLDGATAMDEATYILGGCDVRFSLATAGSLAIYVGGRYAQYLPITKT